MIERNACLLARLALTADVPLAREARTEIPIQLCLLGHPVEYVIVTDDALVPAFQPLADWKTHSRVPAVVQGLASLRTQYALGGRRVLTRALGLRGESRYRILIEESRSLPAGIYLARLSQDGSTRVGRVTIAR